jgi:hypothetical protein
MTTLAGRVPRVNTWLREGATAEAYTRAAAEPREVYRQRILTRGFDLRAGSSAEGVGKGADMGTGGA